MTIIEIKLKRSLIGASEKQILVASSLGLRKVGDKVKQPKSPATMGKIHKISHLLEVIEK